MTTINSPNLVPVHRAFYAESIAGFLGAEPDTILGQLQRFSTFAIELTQRDAWLEQVRILKDVLAPYREAGRVYFEYSIPRVGRRIDAVVVLRHVVYVLEFKVGETNFTASATDQVWDYALDLKNFHETTHDKIVAPILIATRASTVAIPDPIPVHADRLVRPLWSNADQLRNVFERVLIACPGPGIDAAAWEQGRYSPTPTIIEAAMALYRGHDVAEISRSDSGAINLRETSIAIESIIENSRREGTKAICFVTGVPGAGKTLVGLNIATKHIDASSELYSVFLSGNGPLVAILREALARDKVRREQEAGRKFKLGQARSEVKAFIQNVHHFRDECLVDENRPPIEHVALFDEAQRAWNLEQTAKFMLRKGNRPNFGHSEPEFLISCMNRHADWAVIVCLVGGGQEINTGEAGIKEWVDSVLRSFPDWHVHLSPQLHDSEYGTGEVLRMLGDGPRVHLDRSLHLGVSMRSFRAENVSTFVKALLDVEQSEATRQLARLRGRFPIMVTRSLNSAKLWVLSKARGNERYGMVVSSQAQRLKPHAIDVRVKTDPVQWFLNEKDDVRSSYYLEDVATQFDVQGLELDWTCVVWDGDFRRSGQGWRHFSFKGNRWEQVKKPERQTYLKNAYRVLLTRARQGMVIVVPEGSPSDPTRQAEFYDPTFEYLRDLGIEQI